MLHIGVHPVASHNRKFSLILFLKGNSYQIKLSHQYFSIEFFTMVVKPSKDAGYMDHINSRTFMIFDKTADGGSGLGKGMTDSHPTAILKRMVF